MSVKVGDVFGCWVVIEDLGQVTYGNQGRTAHKVKVKCLGCGTKRKVFVSSLKSGQSTKCSECAHQTHGLYVGIPNTKEGRALGDAIRRCHDPNYKRFKNWGERGIIVADEWRGEGGYERFLAHIGPAPDGKAQLDRYPNNETGSYVPGNVRWATAKENNRNRRDNRRITIDGVTLCLSEWSDVSSVNWATIRYRLERGWSPKQAIFCKPHALDIPPDTNFRLMLLRSCPPGKRLAPVKAA